MDIGEPRRTITVEPLESPVPRVRPAEAPDERPVAEPVEPEGVPAE